MLNAKKSVTRLLAGAVLIVIAGGAAAQQPTPRPPAPRPAPAQHSVQAAPPAPAQVEAPQRTTATYADWVVQCESHAGPPPAKVCDMAQVAQVQGKNIPFSRVAIVHPVKGQPVKLIVQVPVNASFNTDVHLQTSDSDPGVVAPFARCTPNGCFADFDLKEDVLKKLRAASGAGKLSFADAGGHEVVIPLSFNGFSQAFDALAKE
jgi:invasion protein IalB